MQARKLSSCSRAILSLAIIFVIVLSGMAVEVHAQDGDPPLPLVPEIVGGAASTPGEWPWQVALIQGTATGPNFHAAQFCGGSLIHPQWVVTAGHCITDGSGNVIAASVVDVIAGIYNLSTPAAGYQRRDVTQIIRHPNYNGSNFESDIALLRLSAAVTLGGNGETATALVPLVPAGVGSLAGRSSWVTGWGNTQSVPEWPDQLQEVQLPIMANSTCNDAAHYGGKITANMLCAGFDAGGFDACYGDSGGPLVVSDGGQWKLAGIVSSGGGCAQPFRPGIYTRVSQFGGWVNSHIGQTTLSSPSGGIGNYSPTYTWNAVATMTYYYLWVNGPNGNVIKKWYTPTEAGCSSGTGTCSVSPSVTLSGGNYTWWVQTWNPAGYGPWSSAMKFSLPIIPAPGAATLTSPAGSYSDDTPTYTWNAVSEATWYYLWVNGPKGNAIKKWYTATEAGCGSGTGACSVTPAVTLGGGNHTWWVQTYNSAGYGPWSSGLAFSLPVPMAPGAAALISPTGSISNNTPTYTWNAVSEATWYYLWVDGPGGNKVKQWYTAAQAGCGSGTGTCSVSPAVTLGGGNHTWRVQTYNSAGYGPWSSLMSFSLPVPTAPGAATLVSPTGNITDDTPTYTWNAVSGATWYYLWVNGPGGVKVQQWYPAASACSGGSCSATPTVALGPGSHTWWVQTYNSVGYGPWSSGLTFSLPVPWPVQPTLISPGTSTSHLTPTYTWNAVSSETGSPATWYYLFVNGPGGNVIKQWYTAEQVGCISGAGTCSVTPTTPLVPGTYTWWVQPYNAAGYGSWSSGLSFAHTSLGGFNSQFNGSADNWGQLGGTWSIANNSWYTITGLSEYSGSAYYYPALYTNLDYSARLRRAGCVWCDNFLYVRGSAFLDRFGFWSDGYQFAYANDGYFAVWKAIGGSGSLLQDYTFTSAITQDGWNTLRVVASNGSLYFYINGTLVWQGTDGSLTAGFVGLGMDNFEEPATSGDQLWVDWAVLNSYAESAPVITDTVSAEQQALNEAANAVGSDKKDGGYHP